MGRGHAGLGRMQKVSATVMNWLAGWGPHAWAPASMGSPARYLLMASTVAQKEAAVWAQSWEHLFHQGLLTPIDCLGSFQVLDTATLQLIFEPSASSILEQFCRLAFTAHGQPKQRGSEHTRKAYFSTLDTRHIPACCV